MFETRPELNLNLFNRSIDWLKGKTVYVLGLGSTGIAAVHFLLDWGVKVQAWDDNPDQRKLLPQGAHSLSPQEVDWATIAAMLKSPGIPETDTTVQMAQDANIPLVSDIDLLYLRDPQASYIGITGTNGKSTTTALIGHLLKEAGYRVEVGGNIGRPALDLPQLGEGGIYVLELSSYQLLLTNHVRFNAAVLVNLSPDHLARHGDMESYLAAKARIFDRQQGRDVRVISMDNYELEQFAMSLGLSAILRRTSVTGPGADIAVTDDGRLLDHSDVPVRTITNLTTLKRLPGRHNWQNIACAWAAVKDFMSADKFVKGLQTFPGLEHRMQQILTAGQVTFVNDSKATNADAANRALESFQNIFWILGGEPKTDGIDPCMDYLQNVQAAYLIGKAEDDFAAKLEGKMPTTICHTLDVAVEKAYQEAAAFSKKNNQPSFVVLAPACASWDQYQSFEHRGRHFVELANKVAKA